MGYRPFRGGRLGVALACAAVLVGSCSSTGLSAQAEPTVAPGDPLPSTQEAPPGSDVVLLDLADATAVAGWTTVNDPVMGGRSSSGVTFSDGGLTFAGTISLENNGGFASARGPRDPGIGRRAAGATALRVRATGDGKTYLLKLSSAGQQWSYVQRFATDAGVPRTYDLPIADFQAVGMRLDPAPDAPRTVDPSRVDQLSFYILDKQQGPFALTVRAIDAAV